MNTRKKGFLGLALSLLMILLFTPFAFGAGDISSEFVDANFKQAVWEWLGNPIGSTPEEFTIDDIALRAETNTVLKVSRKNISQLNGIENFNGTSLMIADFSYNQVTDLPPGWETWTFQIDYEHNPIKTEYISDDANIEWVFTDTEPMGLRQAIRRFANHGNNSGTITKAKLRHALNVDNPFGKLGYLYLHGEPAGAVIEVSNLKSLDGMQYLEGLGLKELDISSNMLTTIENLPNEIEILDISGNYFLTEIINLPTSLRVLEARECHELVSLPELNEGVEEIYFGKYTGEEIDRHKLNSIYNLPSTLKILYARDCSLVSLPPLPQSLEVFECQNNFLKGTLTLPSSLYRFMCTGNSINDLIFQAGYFPAVHGLSHNFLDLNNQKYLDSGISFSSQYKIALKCIDEEILEEYGSVVVGDNLPQQMTLNQTVDFNVIYGVYQFQEGTEGVDYHLNSINFYTGDVDIFTSDSNVIEITSVAGINKFSISAKSFGTAVITVRIKNSPLDNYVTQAEYIIEVPPEPGIDMSGVDIYYSKQDGYNTIKIVGQAFNLPVNMTHNMDLILCYNDNEYVINTTESIIGNGTISSNLDFAVLGDKDGNTIDVCEGKYTLKLKLTNIVSDIKPDSDFYIIRISEDVAEISTGNQAMLIYRDSYDAMTLENIIQMCVSNGFTYSLYSSNSSIATVSTDGYASGISAGSCTAYMDVTDSDGIEVRFKFPINVI